MMHRAYPVLVEGLDDLRLQLNQNLITQWLPLYDQWPQSNHSSNQPDEGIHRQWIEVLQHEVSTLGASIEAVTHLRHEFQQRIRSAATAAEIEQHIMTFVTDLGASKRQQKRDKQAFSRWFGQDAVLDRAESQIHTLEYTLSFCLERLGSLWHRRLLTERLPTEAGQTPLDFQKTLTPLLSYEGDERVRIAAFQALSEALSGLPKSAQEGSLAANMVQYVYRLALEKTQSVWLQVSALALLANLSPQTFVQVLALRFRHPGKDDDIFVRRQATTLLLQHLGEFSHLSDLLKQIQIDPSDYVRQGLTDLLGELPVLNAKALLYELIGDACPQVRAAALLRIPDLILNRQLYEDGVACLCLLLRSEQDPFVLRTGLLVLQRGHRALLQQGAQCDAWLDSLRPRLQALQTHENISVQRWATYCHEQVWAQSTPTRLALWQALQHWVTDIPIGRRRSLRPFTREHSKATLFRLLSVIAQEDFGFEVERGVLGLSLTRGPLFGWQLWRFWHELRNPSTEKRQGYRHTIGRLYFGRIQIPSAKLAELSPTKVPGEPVFLDAQGGWQPHIPLADQMLATLTLWRLPMRIYTAEGVTLIIPPRFIWQRLWAWMKITMQFASIAQRRNLADTKAYLAYFQQLGFQVSIVPH